MGNQVTFDEALALVTRLPANEKIRLIERIAPQIERELRAAQNKTRKSLRGIWRGVEITEEDIADARREVWKTFPRQDI